MTDPWDSTVDVLVAGSGAAGLSAAIAAADDGLDVLVVESTSKWGGTTSVSGGGLWMPANPLMLRDGVPDSAEEALRYMDEVIAEAGPASSPERRKAFVRTAPEVVAFLGRHGVRWRRSPDYPDYYPDRPGGKVGRAILVSERSFPFSIMVDANGERFTNESASYIDVGHDMLAHNVPGPMWLISDVRHTRRYLNTALLGQAKKCSRAGLLVQAPTLESLAAKIGVDAVRLGAAVKRFNGFARSGVDEDFGRGRTVYDNYYGDPRVKPNPNLAPLEKGPFRAVRVYPGDLGTKGGLLTDEHARVLREDGTAIPGLYAAGNTTASVMGRTYPGPGSTIGPAVVFGYRAARHAASR
ncbi:FAD-dependent oxidoreductase [Nonomuraea sp. NPDC049709]|uniref:FAD-dependent oxidoreductase n=1 Tax=Nonomuraea sp. NPDC049709 TaxID=3154736 RepID=UPI00343F8DE4